MNKLIICLFLLLPFTHLFAQTGNSSTIFSYDKIEKPPVHPDCEASDDFACSLDKISAFLTKNFNPDLFGPNDPFLNFKVKFIIDRNGKVVWSKGLSKYTPINNEAEKLLKELPTFIPGKNGDEAFSVMYMMPITVAYIHKFPGSYSTNEVDQLPFLDECTDAEDMYKCMTKELATAINHNFDSKNLSDGFHSAAFSIEINEEGEISNYNVRTYSTPMKEGFRKLQKHLPKFESGAILNGEKVKTTLNIPVKVKVRSHR